MTHNKNKSTHFIIHLCKMSYSLGVLANHFLVADFVFISQCSSKIKKSKSKKLKKYFECRKKLFPKQYNYFNTFDSKMFEKKKTLKTNMLTFYSKYCKINHCKPTLENFFDQHFSKKEMYSFIWLSLHSSCHYLPSTIKSKNVIDNYFESLRDLLECPKCRKHFKKQLKDEMNYESRETIYWCMFKTHNNVNKRNNKPLMKKTEYKHLYQNVL